MSRAKSCWRLLSTVPPSTMELSLTRAVTFAVAIAGFVLILFWISCSTRAADNRPRGGVLVSGGILFFGDTWI